MTIPPRGKNASIAKTSAANTAKQPKANGNGANLGFEAQSSLLAAAKLKYISNAFEAKRAALPAEGAAAAEDPDEYLAENVFWVPKEAGWSHLQDSAKQPTIGKLIDNAMSEIEKANPNLKGVLPKDYNRPAFDKVMLGELIDLVSGIGIERQGKRHSRSCLRVLPRRLRRVRGQARRGVLHSARLCGWVVEMLEPYKGRVYDPCCGSGGMFVQSEKFVETHGGRIGDIAIYGQESNYTTWRLAKMNLTVAGHVGNRRSYFRKTLADSRECGQVQHRSRARR